MLKLLDETHSGGSNQADEMVHGVEAWAEMQRAFISWVRRTQGFKAVVGLNVLATPKRQAGGLLLVVGITNR